MDIGAAWPAALAQVSAVLRARGVQAPDVDDVAQEVAVRALRTSREFDSDEHFVAWCCRVAINLQIDAARRQRRVSPEPPSDAEGHHDTAATAERRMALDVLADRIAELPEEERRLLFDAEPTESRRDAVRLAVRRHRLRARLAALVEGMVAGVAWVRRLRFPRHLSTPTKASLAAAPLVAVAMMLGPLATDQTPSGVPAVVPDAGGVALPPAVTRGASTEPGRAELTASPGRPGVHSSASSTPSNVRPDVTTVLVGATPAGVPVRVNKIERPVSHGQLICTGGLVGACVPKPPPLTGGPPGQAPTAPLIRPGE